METIEKILKYTSHREYPFPETNWKYSQEWHDTLFFHWKVNPLLLEKYIPAGIQLDTIDNMAWVSLVAFHVKKMHIRNLPGIPYIDNFREINIRTYVIKDNVPGIYMFSIETDKLAEVLITRFFIGLPYQKATITVNEHSLFSSNPKNKQCVDIMFNTHGWPIIKSATELWLSERYCLYESHDDKLYRFDIHHKEWDLMQSSAEIDLVRYKAGEFILNVSPDMTHYCKKLKVLLWSKKQVGSTNAITPF